MKLSAVVAALGLVMSALLVQLRQRGQHLESVIKDGFRYAGVFAAFYFVVWFFYTSRGWTAAEGSFRPDHLVDKALFSTAAQACATFDVFAIIDRVIYYPNGIESSLGKPTTLTTLAALAIIATTLTVMVIRQTWRNTIYSSLLVSFSIVVTCVVFFFVIKGGVSLEERHFRAAGLVLLPGIIQSVADTRSRVARYAAIIVLGALAAYGPSSWFVNVSRLIHAPRQLHSGFSMPNVSSEVLSSIRDLDEGLRQGNNLFYFDSPAFVMEVSNIRASAPTNGVGDIQYLEMLHLRGVVDRLFVMLPDELTGDGRARAFLSAFADHSKWRHCALGNYRVFVSARNEDDAAISSLLPNLSEPVSIENLR